MQIKSYTHGQITMYVDRLLFDAMLAPFTGRMLYEIRMIHIPTGQTHVQRAVSYRSHHENMI